MKQINRDEISEMEKRYRATFMNSLPGFKNLLMVGTSSADGITNIGLFNSVFHIGANPPLLGMVFRPDTTDHDTFDNIMETGHYTFNNVIPDSYKQAHQTSASYPSGHSEFSTCGFTKYYIDKFKAPFIESSTIKIGLEFRDCIDIAINDTKIVIGEIVHILLDEHLVGADGYVDQIKASTVAVSGLDSYFTGNPIGRLSYAKPGQTAIEL